MSGCAKPGRFHYLPEIDAGWLRDHLEVPASVSRRAALQPSSGAAEQPHSPAAEQPCSGAASQTRAIRLLDASELRFASVVR